MPETLDRHHRMTVLTKEGVRFSLTLAGPFRRFLGWLIDAFTILVISNFLGYITSLLAILDMDIARAINMLLFFIVSIGYRIVLEWWWDGKTIGKHILNMRVMDTELLRLSFHQVVIRNLVRVVDSLPVFYGLGGLVCFLHPQKKRLGDIAGNTVVVYNPEPRQPDVTTMMKGHYNSFSEHPHLEARLRKKTESEEGRIAMDALLRRDRIDPDERVKLFEQLAEHFQQKVTFPDEVTVSLTPEQYVRNVVDTLYRTGHPDTDEVHKKQGEETKETSRSGLREPGWRPPDAERDSQR